MGFFLLGRSPNDGLVLLSDVAHATKSDALAELSRLTADPGFPHWDAEVFVVDLDSAMPVLLVRPATAEKTAAPVEAAEAQFEESAATIESPEVEAVVAAESEQDVAAEETETEEALVVEEPIAEAVVEDAEAAEESGGTLKDALMRTAAQMEAEGIVAPESVGPAEEPEAEAEGVPAESVAEAEEPAAAGEASWPWDTAQDAEATGSAKFSLSALEEPAVDVEGGLLRTTMDDETFAAAKPVILGAYGEDQPVPAEPEPELQPEPEPAAVAPEPEPAAAAPEPEPVPEPAAAGPEPEPEPVAAGPEPEVEAVVVEQEETDEISDFIFDLEASIAESAPGEAPASAEESAPVAPETVAEVVAGMSCEDCVYVATCPNKDQRDPATCGSFQWK